MRDGLGSPSAYGDPLANSSLSKSPEVELNMVAKADLSCYVLNRQKYR